MDVFNTWTAIAAPIEEPNVDTNQLCPTRFNKVARGPDYAHVLFHDQRFHQDGTEKPDFLLNRPPFRQAGILVADRNFGCGSSRESAVYALRAFGIRAIVAASFGEIFFSNCLKNSLLPVVLDAETCAGIRGQLQAQPGRRITVDLEHQVVRDAVGTEHAFGLHPLRKRCLLEGLDDVSLTLRYQELTTRFEREYKARYP